MPRPTKVFDATRRPPPGAGFPFGASPRPFEQAGDTEREDEAQAINDFVEGLPVGDSDADIIVLGVLNTLEFANDLSEILPDTGDEQLLTNLTDLLEEQGADDLYTFIFDGNSQVLDHIFVTDGHRSREGSPMLVLVDPLRSVR